MRMYENRYLKRIEEECFLNYEGGKIDVDVDGDALYLNSSENHKNADKILTDLLKELGYKKLVERYEFIAKWYD